MMRFLVLSLALVLSSAAASAENLAVSVDENPAPRENDAPAAPAPAAADKAASENAAADAASKPGGVEPSSKQARPVVDTPNVVSDMAASTPDAGVPGGPASAVPAAPRPSNVPADRMPTLALKVSPNKATVGEEITWELSVKRRKEDSVHLSSGADFGSLELKSKSSLETPIDNDWVRDTLTVALIGFEAGDITIPGQILTVVDVDGNIAEVETEAADVTVSSLIANEPEPALKEDTGAGEVVMEEDYLLLYILAGLGAALLVVLLTLLARKLWAMRRPKPEPPPPPPRPAEEVAYEKLNAIRESKLLVDGEFKEFHVRLSEAVREYIGNRYGFDSLELSSEELISALRRVRISKTEYELVLDFLGETDLVKFAKVLPTITESEDLLEQSFGFVDRTTPKASPDADNGSRNIEKGGK